MVKLPVKEEKRHTPLAVRIKQSTFDKLTKLSEKTGLSKTEIIEHLIETAAQDHAKSKKRSKK